MNAGTCPNEADLLAWADQAEGSAAVGTHVETCAACRQQLDELRQALTQVRLSFRAEPKADARATGSSSTPSSLGKYLVVGRLVDALNEQRGFESFRSLHPLLHVDLRVDVGHEAVPNVAEYREPLAAEVRRLMTIENPQLSRIRDSGFFNDRLYLVADYGQDERLDQRIAQGGLTADEAAGVVSGLAQAAVPLVEASLSFREIHPSGILLRESGDPLWTDWGALCALGARASGEAAPLHQLLACLFLDVVSPRAGTHHAPASARSVIGELQRASTISAATAKSLHTAPRGDVHFARGTHATLARTAAAYRFLGAAGSLVIGRDDQFATTRSRQAAHRLTGAGVSTLVFVFANLCIAAAYMIAPKAIA